MSAPELVNELLHRNSAKEKLASLLAMNPPARIKACRRCDITELEEDLLLAGCPPKDIAELMMEIGLGRGAVIESTCTKVAGPSRDTNWCSSPAGPDGFQFLGIDEIEYRPRSRGLVKGVIDQGAFVVTYGPSNSSKTFLALDMALHVASGRAWQGRKTVKTLVVYVASEGAGSITNRIAAHREHYLKDEEDVLFYVLPQPVNLLDKEGAVGPLIAAIKALEGQTNHACGFVVIDTLSQSMPGGDENGPKDMTTVVAAVNTIRRELACTVNLIHHTGKNEAAGARGHSSLRAATDTELEVSEVGEGYFQMKPTKQRDYAMGETFSYRLDVIEIGVDEDGDMQTTCVVVPVDRDGVPAIKKRGKLGTRGEILAQCMEQLLADDRGVLPPKELQASQSVTLEAGQFALNVPEVRKLFYKRMRDDPDMADRKPDSLLKAFKRTLKAAQDSGNIAVYEKYVWFTE